MYHPIAITLLAPVLLAVVLYARRDARAWITLLAMLVVPVVVMGVSVVVAFSNLNGPLSADRILSTSFTLLPAVGAATGFVSLLVWPRVKEPFSLRAWIPAAAILPLLVAAVLSSVVLDDSHGIRLDWFFEVTSGSILTSSVQSDERAVDVLVGSLVLAVFACVVSWRAAVTRPLAYGTAAVFAAVAASLVHFAAEAAEGKTRIGFGYTEAEMADIANFIHVAHVGYAVTIVLVAIAALLTFLATRSALRARS